MYDELDEGFKLCAGFKDQRRFHAVILGPPGSGKTLLARELAGVFRASFTCLDDLFAEYYVPGRYEASTLAFTKALRDKLSARRVVSEGFFPKTVGLRFALADLIIVCEPPSKICRRAVFKRGLANLFGLPSTMSSLARVSLVARLEHAFGSRLYREIDAYWNRRRASLLKVLSQARCHGKVVLISHSLADNKRILQYFAGLMNSEAGRAADASDP
jgi:adenylate kinase family enzyme